MIIEVSEHMANELRQWVRDERERWPDDTVYQADLARLAGQLDQGLSETTRG